MLSKEQKQRIERIENLSLKIIYPASTEYKDRTSRHNVTPIIDLFYYFIVINMIPVDVFHDVTEKKTKQPML